MLRRKPECQGHDAYVGLLQDNQEIRRGGILRFVADRREWDISSMVSQEGCSIAIPPKPLEVMRIRLCAMR